MELPSPATMADRNPRIRIIYFFIFLIIFLAGILSIQHMDLSYEQLRNLGQQPSYTPEFISDILDSLRSPKKPDFAQYEDHEIGSMSDRELGLDTPGTRIIMVGDLHGMLHSLNDLLDKVNYSPKYDTILHTGDIINKGPSSLDLVAEFSKSNIRGVRGNHDQKVLEWRAWFNWVREQKGGDKWLDKAIRKEEKGDRDDIKWEWEVPEGMKWGGPHWDLGRHITEADYNYLVSLPLVLHLPSLHTHLVHGGILPHDPTISPRSPKQPLSRPPHHPPPHNKTVLRNTQELSVLTRVSQNREAWNKLNMRSVLPDGEVTRDQHEGIPWSVIWNEEVAKCRGFGIDYLDKKEGLPCYPITVVYGHAASRGVDLKRYSKGLDSGCVRGRQLSAIVLSQKGEADLVDGEDVGFESAEQKGLKAKLVSVECELK